ncbi:18027_t:CDS:2, partial [Cetraspora pellucida]
MWGGTHYNPSSMTTILNSVGITRSRERAFIFGGIEKYNVCLEDRQMSVIPLNIARLKFENTHKTSSNLTMPRLVDQ